MSFRLLPSPYAEDQIPYFLIEWWVKYRLQVVTDLERGKRSRRSMFGNQTDNLLFYPPISYITEKKMNGRKPKSNASNNSVKSNQSAPIEWVNAPLSDKDYSRLESDTVELEVLSASLIGLVANGYGVSVKYDFERERFNCVIYRPSVGHFKRSLGLSGHAPDLRDAIAVTLYRLHIICGGALTDDTPTATSHQPSKRFG